MDDQEDFMGKDTCQSHIDPELLIAGIQADVQGAADIYGIQLPAGMANALTLASSTRKNR